MSLLLDTHSFLWFIAGSSKLSEPARLSIENPETELYLSIASLWEMAIKISLGKLQLGEAFGELIPAQLSQNGISLLQISVDHTAGVIQLPFHHRDPFDRLIIAQAQSENLPIISTDSVFDAYDIERIW